MSDKRSENTPLVRMAADKANLELSNRTLSDPDEGKIILSKYEESEVNRDNSFKDYLTGLLNRRGVIEETKLVLGTQERSGTFEEDALIGIDLIGLKRLNETLTPEGADKVLQTAANYLSSQVRTTDLAARWGGDEFLLVLFGTNKTSVERLIKRINGNLPNNVKLNIGFRVFGVGYNAEESIVGIMNKMEEVKKIGGVDETGRSIGNGVVVDVDTLK